jgi:hypothetical protein
MTDLSSFPLAHSADVVVCGGGPAGIAAAVAAAETGANTLLIEHYGFLGGMMTAGLVNPFMGYWAGEEQINRGVFQRIIDALSAENAYGTLEHAKTAFDPEVAKLVLDGLVLDAGVKLRLHTTVCGAQVADGQVQRILIQSKSGLEAVEAKVFVDCTGDADLAFCAGAQIEKGRPEDGLCQPMTANFRVAGVDRAAMPSREEINALYDAAREAGEVENPRENVLWFLTTRAGEIHFNTTRVVRRDATNALDLTAAELESRRQITQMLAFLKARVPGFADAYLTAVPAQIGIRESRRVIGDYVLTAEDVLAARKFDDGIARGSYPVDIHSPTGGGTVIKRLPPGEAYDIPYRCLCPLGFENLLIGGRPISSDHAAHSSHRVMPIAACNGEAAGLAAALCAGSGGGIRSVEAADLRQRLASRGASIYGLS